MTLLPAYYGEFGGQFVPESLLPALDQLEQAFVDAFNDDTFMAEYRSLLRDYLGRPTPLTECRNLPVGGNARIFLKREDLAHGGAHKTNQVIGQALLAKKMGKTRIIAETGAGQHGTATALACALLGLDCVIYMGKTDMQRQAPNVYRMRLMGAKVVGVESGAGTLKDAVNEALRDWTATFHESHYLLGTAAGPHPSPRAPSASCTAPARTSCVTTTARSKSPTPSPPAWTTRPSARSTPTSPSPAVRSTCPSPTTRPSTPSRPYPATKASSRRSSPRTPWPTP